MSLPPPTLDQLIDEVRGTGTAASVERVGAAVETAARLERLGDHLVRYFIDEARDGGVPWHSIGQRLGISRQAVQKRYAPETGEPTRLPPVYATMVDDCKRTIVAAQEAARRRDGTYIGTEHLLLGLISVPDCVGVRALARCALDPIVIQAAIDGRIGRAGANTSDDKLPFTSKAKATLEHALRESLRLGHSYVGTGHLALGLLTVQDSTAAKTLHNLGLEYGALRNAVVDLAPDDPRVAG